MIRAAIVALQAACLPALAPGGVEIVAIDGHIAHVRAHGYADLEQSMAMRRDMAFRIASLTKQFTAVAILRLVQDGHIALDDPLSRRLPNCPKGWNDISLRQLLSHTSGLSADMSAVIQRLRDDLSPAELVALHESIPLVSVPGTRWSYANLNYWILGLVIEAASGRPYDKFVGDYVLAPAGLSATRIGSWTPLIPNRAHGYREARDGNFQNAIYFSSELGYAAGGFVSTADDMTQWYDALGRGLIVSRDLLTQAWTPVLLANGETSGFGLGW